LKCPESVAKSYKPLTCRLHQWILRHILIISSSCAMLVGSAMLRRRIQRKQCFSRRVEELYDQVCDFLEENAVASNSAETSNCEPWVIASWLRDYLLLPRERRDPLLWTKVCCFWSLSLMLNLAFSNNLLQVSCFYNQFSILLPDMVHGSLYSWLIYRLRS
jgi:hypothetical protein